jgi:hypothetical protein
VTAVFVAEFSSLSEKEDWPMSFPLLRFAALIVCILLPTTLTRAETLPLPQSLIGAATDQGEALFLDADAREAYFPLASNFLTQQNQAFCGVASMVMVLNALELPAPAVPAFDPYRTFTQDNVLDARTKAVLPVEVIKKMGITLDQLGGLLAVQPVTVSVHHAADSSVETFRSQARDALAASGQFVIVNYLRKAIGQERGGAHFAACRLRCGVGPLPHPRRGALQISARVGENRRTLRRHEHAGL